MQCLKKNGVTNNTSPDSFSENRSSDELKRKLSLDMTQQAVEFKQWKRVTCDDGKQRTKLLDVQKETTSFSEDITTEFDDFKDHTRRVKAQFQSCKQMKESLKINRDHVCV